MHTYVFDRSRIFQLLYNSTTIFPTITSSRGLLSSTVFSFSLSRFHRCPAILPGTMDFVEPSSAHKIDLCNLPDTVRLPSLWSFRVQIHAARSFNEFIQPCCVLLSRWLSTESISGLGPWCLSLWYPIDIYLASSNSQISCVQETITCNANSSRANLYKIYIV